MKSIFALALGTIALLLAITVQDSPGARIFLASVGLALYAVALSPGAARGEPKASWHLKPSKPKQGEFSYRPQMGRAGRNLLTQSMLTSSRSGTRWVSPLIYRSSMQPHNAAEPDAPSLPLPQRVR